MLWRDMARALGNGEIPKYRNLGLLPCRDCPYPEMGGRTVPVPVPVGASLLANGLYEEQELREQRRPSPGPPPALRGASRYVSSFPRSRVGMHPWTLLRPDAKRPGRRPTQERGSNCLFGAKKEAVPRARYRLKSRS